MAVSSALTQDRSAVAPKSSGPTTSTQLRDGPMGGASQRPSEDQLTPPRAARCGRIIEWSNVDTQLARIGEAADIAGHKRA